MYFWNVLPATTNFSQSISYFAFLLRNPSLSFYWGANVFVQLINSTGEKVNTRGWDASVVRLWPRNPGMSTTTPRMRLHLYKVCYLYLSVLLDQWRRLDCLLFLPSVFPPWVLSISAFQRNRKKQWGLAFGIHPTTQRFMVPWSWGRVVSEKRTNPGTVGIIKWLGSCL